MDIHLENINKNYQEMEQVAQSLGQSQLKQKVKNFKKAKQEALSIQQKAEAILNEQKRLFETSQGYQEIQKKKENNLAMNTAIIDTQGNQLNRMNDQGHRIENKGDLILEKLHEQQQILDRAVQDNKEIDVNLNMTDKLTKMLRNRELFNKLILLGLIVFLTLANLVLIVVKLAF